MALSISELGPNLTAMLEINLTTEFIKIGPDHSTSCYGFQKLWVEEDPAL
jgi:hypothetical protein